MRCLFLIYACSAIAWAQNAELSGRITDAANAVISEAVISITRTETGAKRTVKSNGEGLYFVPALIPGRYLISVQKEGFQTSSRTDVLLETAQNARLDFQLAVGSVEQTVTVAADALPLNTGDAAVGTVVTREFVENVPLNGRSLQSLITISPGTALARPPYGSRGDSGEFSVNGQRTDTNYFMVDGASANYGVGANGLYGASGAGGTPNSSALGSTHGMISLDALQEFRIQTSTYAAEYGRGPGAQVSLTSRSGTNTFHGTLFDYFRNDALDANNWFNNRAGLGKTPERQNDFGGTLGGPVILPGYNGRNRTFFFFSYEGLRLRLPQGARTVQVPGFELRKNAPALLQPVMNAFPIPNGDPVLLPGADGVLHPSGLAYFTASYSDPASLDATSIRVDQRLSGRINIFGRFQSTPSSRDSRSSLTSVSQSSNKAHALTLGGDAVISPAVVNQLRFNSTWSDSISRVYADGFGGGRRFTLDDFFSKPYPEWSQTVVSLAWGGLPQLGIYNNGSPQGQWNLVDSVAWNRGEHSFKFGVDYRQTTDRHRVRELWAIYAFNNIASVLANSADQLTVGTQAKTGQQPRFKNFSAYAQDEWRVSPALTLSLGLRWDINPPVRNTNGDQPPVLNDMATLTVAPPGTRLYETDFGGFGPRIGLAYQIRKTPGRETVLRTGYGLFFDTGQQQTGRTFLYAGYRVLETFSEVPFPLPDQFYEVKTPSLVPPYQAFFVGVNRNLKLPYSGQWNFTLEQRLGGGRSVSAGYVGSSGRRLITTRNFSTAAKPEFNGNQGLAFVDNDGYSDYHSLQIKFQQALSRSLQLVGSYTWSHSIDNNSTGFESLIPLMRGDSDFDVRHNFQSALTYNLPSAGKFGILGLLTRGWGIDARVSVNTAMPLDPNLSSAYLPNGTQEYVRPDRVPGQPLYVYGPQFPGGKAINYAAFRRSTMPQGNLPRNVLRGFGVSQINASLRRDFRLNEGVTLQFRGEAYNLFNHPSFGDFELNWTTGPAQFGQAKSTLNTALRGLNDLYQIGGPRSLQLALKLVF